jgi:hypothetical protein
MYMRPEINVLTRIGNGDLYEFPSLRPIGDE